jgi:hypothetical protein
LFQRYIAVLRDLEEAASKSPPFGGPNRRDLWQRG